MSELDNRIRKILDYRIPKRIIPKNIVEELNIGDEGYKIGDALEETDVFFPQNSDKPSIKTSSLEKLWEKLLIGANKIEVTMVGPMEFYAKARVELEDGRVYESYGEYNGNHESEMKTAFPVATAENRARKRALLKAIGLFPYLSEVDEEDKKLFEANREVEIARKVEEKLGLKQKEFDDKIAFMEREYQQRIERMEEEHKKELEKLENAKEKNTEIIKKLYGYVSLPKDDEVYPSEKISDIKDKSYLMKLQKHEDQMIKIVAANYFRELKKEEIGVEEKIEEAKKNTGLVGKIKKGKDEKKKTQKIEQKELDLPSIPKVENKDEKEVKQQNQSTNDPFGGIDDFMKDELEKIKKQKKDE